MGKVTGAKILNWKQWGSPKLVYLTPNPDHNKVICKVAEVAFPLLLLGDPGVGRQRFVECIHGMSKRRDKNCVRVPLHSIDEDSFLEKIFGIESSGKAGSRKDGYVDLAEGGTLFLDQVHRIPSKYCDRISELLSSGRFIREGGDKFAQADIRIIAGSEKGISDLRESLGGILSGELDSLRYEIKPLKEHTKYISGWLERTMYVVYVKSIRLAQKPTVGFPTEEEVEERMKIISKIPKEILSKMETYHFPGNFHELTKMVRTAFTFGDWESVVFESPDNTAVDEIKNHFDGIATKIVGGEVSSNASRDDLHRMLDDVLMKKAVEKVGKSPRRIRDLLDMNVNTVSALEAYKRAKT